MYVLLAAIKALASENIKEQNFLYTAASKQQEILSYVQWVFEFNSLRE